MTNEQRDEEQTPNQPAEAVVHVDIDAAPDDVWRALSTDEGLASWIGEGSTVGDDVGDEIRVHDVVTGRDRRGYLDEFTPGRRLGYTWWPDTEPDQATRVAISLEPTHTGTRVTVVESRPLVSTGSTARTPQASTAMMASFSSRADWTWRCTLLNMAVNRAMCHSQISHG